jgi:amino acid transporter
MKYVIPVILAVGTILSALTIAILTQNNYLKGYNWALPYLAIIIAGLLIVALAISIRNSLQDRKSESVNPPPSTTTQTVSQSVSPQQNVYIGKDLLQPSPHYS